MYGFLPLMLMAIWGVPLLAIALGAADDAIMPLTGVSVFAAFVGWATFNTSGLSKCRRCNHPLSRHHNIYWPIVLWRHCPQCGVRHSATPDEVHANPMAHLRIDRP